MSEVKMERIKAAAAELDAAITDVYGEREPDERGEDEKPEPWAFSCALMVELWMALGRGGRTIDKARQFQYEFDRRKDATQQPIRTAGYDAE